MTWLDEIEDEANLALEGDEDIGEYMDKLRMARVIRELAKALNDLPCEIEDWDKTWFNLSPDVKELLDESTTPSPT